MTIWTTTNTAINSSVNTLGLSKARTFAMDFNISGLTPNTVHTFHVNNTDMSFAVQPFGQRIGTQIMSDAKGNAKLTYYGEMRHDYIIPRDSVVKQHTFELRDTLGNTRAISIIPQTVYGRK